MGTMRRLAYLASFASLIVAAACSSSDKPDATANPTTSAATPSGSPGEADRVVVSGTSTLDGRPFDSRWVGAVVLDNGLVTPCQATLPPVTAGRYSVPVFSDTASSGCGKPGTRVALWVYGTDKVLFSTNTIAWPDDGGAATFAATYSAADPKGATPAVAQFQGGAYGANGQELPAGTRVDAYVGTTRCGVAAVRKGTDFTGYILSVVGPDSVPGCTRGAPIAFRIDGAPAETAGPGVVNTPPGRNETLNLGVR